MSLNTITFLPGEGGLGRPLLGGDHISGLVYYTSTLPSGYSTTDRIKKILSPAQAVALGIVKDYSDETKATGTYTVTAVGATGDTVDLKFTEPDGTVVTLGSYTKVSTDTTVTLVAVAIKNAINLLTISHGYTATNAAGVVTITARPGLGIFPNTGTPFSKTEIGTLTGTLAQFSGGAYSKMANFYYHIEEFFRMQPKGVLYVGFFAIPSPYTFTEVATMRTFSNGTIRQLGVYKDGSAFSTANITTLQTVAATFLQYKTTMSILYAADLVSVTDLTTLTDLSTLNSNYVSAVISQDGAGKGFNLFKATGRSITTLGATLGAVALSRVSESISWVGKFNMSNGVECDTLAFANGQNYKDLDINLITTLSYYRYVFMRKFDDYSGSFHTDGHCCTTYQSDYSYIENNRTIGKAIRGVNASLLTELSSPLTLNPDGTLQATTVAHFEDKMEPNLDQMVRDGDLSAYSRSVDPDQDVLSTSKLVCSVGLLPKGVARMIEVPISFVKQI
jgi:hypothetical protein